MKSEIIWEKDTKWSLVSKGDNRFMILTGSKHPITRCSLFDGNKKVRHDYAQVDKAKKHAEKILKRENSLKEVNV